VGGGEEGGVWKGYFLFFCVCVLVGLVVLGRIRFGIYGW